MLNYCEEALLVCPAAIVSMTEQCIVRVKSINACQVGWALQVTLLGEEMQRANPDLDAIERWRAKDAEFTKRSAEVEASRTERDTVSTSLLSSHRSGRGIHNVVPCQLES